MSGRQTFQAKESAPAKKKSSFSWLRPAAAHPAAEAEHEAPSASSPAFAHDFTKVPVRPMQLPGVPGFSCPFAPQRCPSGGACHACPPKMQAKLKIGQPGDRYEQEADRVAETVMRMPEPQVQRKCSAPGCKDEDEDKLVQTKSAGSAGNAQVDHPLIQSVLSSPGQPLDAGTRSFMEPRFGQDFSGVRVHVGGQAAESARAVNARAYTVGRDVVFGEGQYAPGSDEGKRLVAHELVHVGQQDAGRVWHVLQRQPEDIEVGKKYEVKTQKDNLRLRVLPNQDATKGNVKSGTIVLVKKVLNYDWYLVEAETIEHGVRTGYVQKKYLHPMTATTSESKNPKSTNKEPFNPQLDANKAELPITDQEYFDLGRILFEYSAKERLVLKEKLSNSPADVIKKEYQMSDRAYFVLCTYFGVSPRISKNFISPPISLETPLRKALKLKPDELITPFLLDQLAREYYSSLTLEDFRRKYPGLDTSRLLDFFHDTGRGQEGGPQEDSLVIGPYGTAKSSEYDRQVAAAQLHSVHSNTGIGATVGVAFFGVSKIIGESDSVATERMRLAAAIGDVVESGLPVPHETAIPTVRPPGYVWGAPTYKLHPDMPKSHVAPFQPSNPALNNYMIDPSLMRPANENKRSRGAEGVVYLDTVAPFQPSNPALNNYMIDPSLMRPANENKRSRGATWEDNVAYPDRWHLQDKPIPQNTEPQQQAIAVGEDFQRSSGPQRLGVIQGGRAEGGNRTVAISKSNRPKSEPPRSILESQRNAVVTRSRESVYRLVVDECRRPFLVNRIFNSSTHSAIALIYKGKLVYKTPPVANEPHGLHAEEINIRDLEHQVANIPQNQLKDLTVVVTVTRAPCAERCSVMLREFKEKYNVNLKVYRIGVVQQDRPQRLGNALEYWENPPGHFTLQDITAQILE